MTATAAELIADAQLSLDGTPEGELAALRLFRQAGMLAFSQRNYDLAEDACRGAMAYLATVPNTGMGGRGAFSNLTWSAAQIDQLLNQIRSARRADGDSYIESVPVRYTGECDRGRVTFGGSF